MASNDSLQSGPGSPNNALVPAAASAVSEPNPPSTKDYKGFVGGVFSGIAKLSVGHPFDTIKVRLQTSKDGHFKGPMDCTMQTIRKEGVRGLYKGASPPLVGWMMMDSVMLGSLTFYKRLLQENVFSQPHLRPYIPFIRSQPDLTTLPTFGHGIAGIMAGTTVSMIAAPVEHIKARLQIQYAADKSKRLYSGPIDCTRKIFNAHGISGLYRGLCATMFFRSFFFFWWGSYDLITRYMKKKHKPFGSGNQLLGGWNLSSDLLDDLLPVRRSETASDDRPDGRRPERRAEAVPQLEGGRRGHWARAWVERVLAGLCTLLPEGVPGERNGPGCI
ncbi:hypothetical protein N7493_006256 [Penicillium malachiteum]|uniref:Mitochondrial thiamine pyrophosphate carrier 1 n=1 Tax=Penicillium malachiteum TaxID=1324776 RepID=A0AAD6HK88_9EURO|nr:hypothetical protein N7493_006256 [Penicillium malachiteum]